MLILKNIVKHYKIAETTVEALKGVDLSFRKNEFVSVLGPSGCGKTTLLNIIGGLDRYTDGDLSVNGVSTKMFKDGDWDAYRNRSIGFVFQTYNLIPHQTVLSNVELALTLSGVSKAERKKRAVDALNKVGLSDQLYKKPNQVSGGQMQRVAIARALVNDPEILLADEPTGALDTTTSVQIMEILKEISKEKLIIMVTHNPEIAEQYSTRIIKLLDGRVMDDSNPYIAEAVDPIEKTDAVKKSKKKKKSMSLFTAMSLSMNNLMTKKARTFLTSFAGSIGIIGIALILSLSAGVQDYISNVEKETLSSYPISIQKTSVDIGTMLMTAMDLQSNKENHELNKVYSNDMMAKMMESMLKEVKSNDLEIFKKYLNDNGNFEEYIGEIKYGYDTRMNVYMADTDTAINQVNPNNLLEKLAGVGGGAMMGMAGASMNMESSMGGMAVMGGASIWRELSGDKEALNAQYEVVYGKLPENPDEVIVIMNKNNEISDYTLYSLGLKEMSELEAILTGLQDKTGEDVSDESESANDDEITPTTYTYEEITNIELRVIPNTDYYEKTDGIWENKQQNARAAMRDPEKKAEYEKFLKEKIENGIKIKVVGIVRPSANSLSDSESGAVGYTSALMYELIKRVDESEIVADQKNNPETDILTGTPFTAADTANDEANAVPQITEEQMAMFAMMDEDERAAAMLQMGIGGDQSTVDNGTSNSTYEENMALFGVVDINRPSSISMYPKNFEAKDKITQMIKDYNREKTDAGKEEEVIQYTDFVGMMMSSVSNVINTISYVLIAFVAISLVVSSIMIGIITYISVLERTKEIGILRSIGASKKDIARVFNAETLLVGFAAGLIGIGVTVVMCIPINAIIKAITQISNIAALPLEGGVLLIAISMVLTFIAGLLPSRMAANKDPVVALRTE